MRIPPSFHDVIFFARVDELRAFKEKYGHLNVTKVEDQILYGFCSNIRSARRAIISRNGTMNKLTEDRIAALDAIGFEWEKSISATMASKDASFFVCLD
jgi:hypothetical protein